MQDPDRENTELNNKEIAKSDSDGENWIGIALYWLFIYAFSVVIGGLAEIAADFLIKLTRGFAGHELTATLNDVPLLVFVVTFFAALLAYALLKGEKLIRPPLEKAPPWFKAFSLAFIFLGSHVVYEYVKTTH
jgi:H+/Cl- antiporter ClcA